MAQLDNCTDNDIDFEWFDLGSVGSDSAIYQYYTSEFFCRLECFSRKKYN